MKEVYVVIDQGEVVYASRDEDNAYNFADDLKEKRLRSEAEDMDIDFDDEEEGDFGKISFGVEVPDVVEIDLDEYKNSDTISVYVNGKGDVDIEYDDIIKALKKK